MEQVGLLADLAIIFTVSLVVVLLFHRFRRPDGSARSVSAGWAWVSRRWC